MLLNKFQESISRQPEVLDTEGIDAAVEELVQGILQAIQASTPLLRIIKFSVMGYNEECKEAQSRCRRLRWTAQREGTEEAHKAYTRARNYKGRIIKKAKRKGWQSFVEEAAQTPEGLWKLAKWSRGLRGIQAVMPPIKDSQGVLQTSSEEKVQILQEAFFPKPPEADLADIQGYQYPRVDMPEDITIQEMEAVLQRVSAKKALGPDEIPNGILQLLGPM